MVNNEIRKYIEEEILTKYEINNIGGHGIEHIESVIARSFELNEKFNLNLDENMIYVIAAFHDIGYKVDADNHEKVSSEMFLEDETIKNFFDQTQISIMAEAIVDHRASLEYEARSIYGKLVSSADREVVPTNILKRSILFQAGKHKGENPTLKEVIEYSYQKLSKKYGKGGYAKMYFEDDKYINFLQVVQEIIEDKELFIEKELEVMESFGIDVSDINAKYWK